MSLQFPKAVIFDWDNTLVDSWGAISEAMNATLRHFGRPEWDIKIVKANCTRAARDSFPQWFGERWQEASDVFYKRFSAVQMRSLTPAFGSEALLAWLSDKKVPCVVVSNKNGPFLRKESSALGWDKYFGSIVGSTDAPRDKPARDHADHALGLAGLEAGPDVWFVGDSEADIACGKNAKCLPVLIGTPENAKKLGASVVVSDCEELLALLSDLSPGTA